MEDPYALDTREPEPFWCVRLSVELPGPGALSEIPPYDPGPGGPYPPVPLERLRQLTEAERWQALIFLSGLVPDAVERALAAVLTPRSIAGVAWR